MSGVMLKTALYGMMRVSFDLLGLPQWWWGLVPLALGLFSALYGAVFAAVQTDMKRLLAYSSIENIGIMFTGLGLAMVFAGVGMRAAAALTLIAVLYHALNHAFMKSLLFLGTGAVLHATGERNLGHLGGLIHRMPWVAWLTLVGALAIAGLPPLNGFVSEWLLLQAFLFAHEVPAPVRQHAAAPGRGAARAGRRARRLRDGEILRRHVSRAAARALRSHQARDAGFAERIGLAWLALGCVLLGLLPQILSLRMFSDGHPAARAGRIADERRALVAAAADSGAPVVVRAAGVLRGDPGRGGARPSTACASSITSACAGAPPGIAASAASPAACRTPPRASASRSGICSSRSSRCERELPRPFDRAPAYRVEIGDRIWHRLYLPLGRAGARHRRHGRLAAAGAHCDSICSTAS